MRSTLCTLTKQTMGRVRRRPLKPKPGPSTASGQALNGPPALLSPEVMAEVEDEVVALASPGLGYGAGLQGEEFGVRE